MRSEEEINNLIKVLTRNLGREFCVHREYWDGQREALIWVIQKKEGAENKK